MIHFWEKLTFKRTGNVVLVFNEDDKISELSFENTRRGTIEVRGRLEVREGHLVQQCACLCGNCDGLTFYIATSVLSKIPNSSSPSVADKNAPGKKLVCDLGSGYNHNLSPSLDEQSQFFKSQGAKSDHEVYTKNRLPGALYHPDKHPEWCTRYQRIDRWAEFLGVNGFMSSGEIEEALVEYDEMGDGVEWVLSKYTFLWKYGLFKLLVNKLGDASAVDEFFRSNPTGEDIRNKLGLNRKHTYTPRKKGEPKGHDGGIKKARLPIGVTHKSDISLLHRGYCIQQLWKSIEYKGVTATIRKVIQDYRDPNCTPYGKYILKEFALEFFRTRKYKTDDRSWVSAHAIYQVKKAKEKGNNCAINAGEPGVGKTRSVFAITHECFPGKRNFLIFAPDANSKPGNLDHDPHHKIVDGSYWQNEAYMEGEEGIFIVANNQNAKTLKHHLKDRNFILITEYKLQTASKELMDVLTSIPFDFITADEIQIWTGVGGPKASKQRVPNLNLILDKNPNAFRYMMTATMIRTSVREAKSSLENFTRQLNDICVFGDTGLAAMVQLRIEYLRNNGFRLVANPADLPNLARIDTPFFEGNLFINNSTDIPGLIEVHLLEKELDPRLKWGSISLAVESVITQHKVEAILQSPALKKLIKDSVNPLFVTTFVSTGDLPLTVDEERELAASSSRSIIDNIETMCKQLGFENCVEHTGRDKDTVFGEYFMEGENTPAYLKRMYKMGKPTAVVASVGAISTAVDGLQKASNLIIAIATPYTHAQLTQLLGRLRRRGCAFSEIRMVVIIADYAEYDRIRWAKVVERKEGDDCYLEGKMNSKIMSKINQKYEEEREQSLSVTSNFFVKRLGDKVVGSAPVVTPHIVGKRRTYSDIARDHSTWSRLGWKQPTEGYHVANTLQNDKVFGKDAPWYHVYTHDVIPFLKQSNGYALDLGCCVNGPRFAKKNKLNTRLTFVDADIHLPKDLSIICADRRATKLPSGKYGLIVSTLSLFKVIANDSIKEMRRLLAPGGTIIIVESHKDKKWVKHELPKWFKKHGLAMTMEKIGDDKRRFRKYILTRKTSA